MVWNTRLPAVVDVPPPIPPPPSTFHFSFWFTGSHACSPPRAPCGGSGPMDGSIVFVGHGCPVVGASAGRIYRDRFLIVIGFRVHNRAAAFTHAQRPAHLHKRFGGDELAGDAIEDIEE